jgi:hypothetical protein
MPDGLLFVGYQVQFEHLATSQKVVGLRPNPSGRIRPWGSLSL